MRRKILTACTVFAVLALSLVAVAANPNFTGTWVMDTSRSIGLPPGTSHTMIITQTGERIDLETKIINAQGERSIKDSYAIDGREADFVPQGPQGPTGKGKRKSTWLPRGNGILVEEDMMVPGQGGATVNIKQTRKWTLSPDGQTLTMDIFYDTPNGSFEAKRIFIKKTS